MRDWEKNHKKIYRIDLMGKKLILLPSVVLRQFGFPALYPLFEMINEEDKPVMKVAGVRLQIGPKDQGR